MSDKPPYRVPLLAEIQALPWNGLTVASTFAGGGGSSTGYRMAGYRIAYANEFVQAAYETYAANMRPGTVLDTRDIRTVTAEEILERIGMAPGDLDLFDGSPPCESFSTAGNREKDWGKVKAYFDTQQRKDDLFYEYARLLRGLQPKVFMAENVSGLIKGTAKGYFLNILAALKACGYRVEAKLLDAQWLGVPQARQRLIFVGVRNDIGLAPVFPKPLPYRYSVRDALPWIDRHGTAPLHDDWVAAKSDVGSTIKDSGANACPTIVAMGPNKGAGWCEARIIHDTSGAYSVGDVTNRPSPTVMAMCRALHVQQGTERRKFTIAELKRITSFPDDYTLTGSYSQQWARCGACVPPVMVASIAAVVRDRILLPLAAGRIAAE